MNDSIIGFKVAILYNPGGTTDSIIGFATALLVDPPDVGGSLIGFATNILRPPHHPIVIEGSTGRTRHPIRIYDGTSWIE